MTLKAQLLGYFQRGGTGTNRELAQMFGTSLGTIRGVISQLRKEYVIVRTMWRYPEGVTHVEYGIAGRGIRVDRVYPRRGRPAKWCAIPI